jgi:hypothetical protein
MVLLYLRTEEIRQSALDSYAQGVVHDIERYMTVKTMVCLSVMRLTSYMSSTVCTGADGLFKIALDFPFGL